MTIFSVTTFLWIPNSKIRQRLRVKSEKWSSNYFLGRTNKSKAVERTTQSQFWRGNPQDAYRHHVPSLLQEHGWKDGQALNAHHASATGQGKSILMRDFVFPVRKVGTWILSLSEEHLLVSQTLNRSCEEEMSAVFGRIWCLDFRSLFMESSKAGYKTNLIHSGIE